MSYITNSNTSGASLVDPVVTDLTGLNGRVVASTVRLYSNANFLGAVRLYSIPQTDFVVPDNAASYLVADYNSGSPIFRVTTDVNEINESNVVPINTFLTLDGHIHMSHWDRVADGMVNKLHRRFVKTQRYAWESGCGLGQTAGVVKIDAGNIWRGGRAFSLQDTYSDGTNTSYWYFFYHSSSTWTHTDSGHAPTAGFNYTQYDPGTNLALLTGNQHTINWIFRGVEDHQHGYYVVGDKAYKDLPTAQAETTVPALPEHISTHAILVGRIICKNGVSTPVLIESAFNRQFAGAIINEHNDLSGLDGGISGQYYHFTADDHTRLPALPVDINRCGFLNQTETTISFDENTFTFTIAPVGVSWSYYRAGIKYTITGSKTIDLTTIDNPLINATKYYIFLDSTDGTLSALKTPWSLQDTKVPVAIVAWNATLTPKYLLQEERHSCIIDRREHLYLHNTRGTQYITGGELTGYTTATNTDAANTFSIGQAVIADEDIYQTLGAVADGNGANATNYYVMYRIGASTWVWAASDMPFSYTPGGYINWDNAGTLTEGTGGAGGSIRYYNTYLIFTNTQGALRHVIVPGQNTHTSTTSAYAESFAGFTLTGFPKEEWLAMYQLTWQTGAAGLTNKGKCQLTRAPQRITTTVVTASQTTPVPHNSLTGLQGGTTGEYYHLTAAAATTAALLLSGTGTPEGSITAGIGTLFLRTDGGANTTLYVKESGIGNTGWVGK